MDPVAYISPVIAGNVMACQTLIGVKGCMMRMGAFQVHDGGTMTIHAGISGNLRLLGRRSYLERDDGA